MSPDPPGQGDPTCPQSCVNTLNASNAVAYSIYLASPRTKDDAATYANALAANAAAAQSCIAGCPEG